jgi:hypothetical protein
MDGQFKVGRYVVSRVAFEITGSSGSEPERRMTLLPAPEYSGPIVEAVLYFRGPFFGDLPTIPHDAVRAILPPSEFEYGYKILQTENPVFLDWEAKGDNTLRRLSLSSDAELPGKGIDQSP